MKRSCFAFVTVLYAFATCLGGVVTGNEQDSKTTSRAEAERIASVVVEWIKPYQKKFGIKTEHEDEAIYLHGTFGALPSVFSTFDITVAIYAKEREVSFIGYLPTIVPNERRKAMLEFIFRGELGYGLSPASMVLDDQGEVRCQAWLPFESFTFQPKESKWRLMGAVVDKLWSFSAGVASVALGGDPVKAAAGLKRIDAFEGLDEAAALKKAADVDTKIVLEKCFDKDVEVIVGDTGNKWLNTLSGCGRGARVGIINGHFEDVVRDMGGRYDVLPYSLVVREGMVWNVCNVPDAVPDEAIDKAADWAMRLNESLKYALFSVDFDTGKMWCHYGLPVSVLPSGAELPPRNVYGALLKILPIRGVATHSEDLHLAVVKALLRTDETADTSLSSMESLSQQAGTVATWLRGHLKDTKWDVVTNGTGRIVVSGLVRGYCPNVEDCSFEFDLNAVGGGVVCRGELSKAVPEAKLPDVQALLLSYGSRSGFSIGALALDKDRKVQCSASIPLFALRADPKGVARRLSHNILIPLLELSDAVVRVCRDGQKPEKALDSADYPRDVARLLQDPDAEDLDVDATSEEEELIESWFDVLDIRCTRGIETEQTVYYRNKGDLGQGLQECFVMHGDMVLVQCRLDLEIPEGRREAVNDFALKYNATHPVVSLHMGYGADPGDSIYFQCLMPVSVLQARKRNSAAKERFGRILDRVQRSALEMSPKIREIVK